MFLDDGQTERNVLEGVSAFTKFSRNGVDLDLQFCTGGTISYKMLEFAFALQKSNMKTQFEATGGWDGEDKKRELVDPSCRFIIARLKDEGRIPVAFARFSFTLEGDHEVLYCNDLQLTPSVQRKVS